MLIIKKREKSAPATFTHMFRGQEISLTVRPFDQVEIEKIIKKHTKFVTAVHPLSKQAVRIPEPDNKAIGEDLIDHLLVDFSGFGFTEGEPLAVTRENKLLISSLQEITPEGEEPVYLSSIIQNKARELAEAVEIEEKALTKN